MRLSGGYDDGKLSTGVYLQGNTSRSLAMPYQDKNRGQLPSVSCFIARYAKNYFFRTTSPPRPVCAVMYSRPILAYSNGLALAGSCSASTMIQPV